MSTEPNTAVARLKELIDEMDKLTRKATAEARDAVHGRMRSEHYPPTSMHDEGWSSQAEKSLYWPKQWVPMDHMCEAIVTGVGSGEGHAGHPGFMACTRLAGHRDIRTGRTTGHTWGPERYSESRARSAANRVATEEWAQFTALLPVADGGVL